MYVFIIFDNWVNFCMLIYHILLGPKSVIPKTLKVRKSVTFLALNKKNERMITKKLYKLESLNE